MKMKGVQSQNGIAQRRVKHYFLSSDVVRTEAFQTFRKRQISLSYLHAQ